MHSHRPASLAVQRGAATLLISLIMLIAITLVVIVTSRAAFMEQRMSGNEIRAKQSFESAQAGIDYAIAYLTANGGIDHDDNNVADTLTAAKVTLANGSSYMVAFCDTVTYAAAGSLPDCATINTCTKPAVNANATVIYSCGWSDDNAGIHPMVQVVRRGPAAANPPANPLTTQGTVDLRGSGTITNPEGNITIWSGNDVDFTGASPKTMIPDANTTDDNGNGIDDELVSSSDKDSQGLDVVDIDTSLATLTDVQYFQNFFGATPTEYETSVATMVVDPGDVGTLDGKTNEVIWVDGDARFTGNTTIGTPDEPVILIVDGEMFGAGRVTVYGILYVMGDWDAQGNLTVHGSVIVRGMVEGTGSLDVFYNSTILSKTGGLGQNGSLAGSWRDWR